MNDYTFPDWCVPVLVVAIVWHLFWKLIALWHAARKADKPWFFILFIFNTLGILDIYYIFFVAKIKSKKLFK